MKDSYEMNQHLCNQVLKRRNHTSYSSIAAARGVDNMVSLTKTPQSILLQRNEVIQSTRGLLVETCMKHLDSQMVFTNLAVYKSFYECIMCYMRGPVVWYTKPAPVEGEALGTPFLYGVHLVDEQDQ